MQLSTWFTGKQTSPLIKCRILVNVHNGPTEEFETEEAARAALKPVFVDAAIPIEKIEFFYALHSHPFQTMVQTTLNCVCVDMEVTEFGRLYEQSW